MIGPGKLSTVWGAYEGYFREPSDQMGGGGVVRKETEVSYSSFMCSCITNVTSGKSL